MSDAQMRTWAEIDLGRLKHNYTALREQLAPGCRFVGVVKANAYGHGAVPVAQKLEEWGADYLAVACLEEAAELRQAGVRAPILILGVTLPRYAGELLAWDAAQAVGDLETGRALSAAAVAAGRTLTIHVKADTGMSRLGFLCDEAHLDHAAGEIAALCALPGLRAEGIFTHFSDADGCEAYTMRQFTRFLDLLDKLSARGVTFEIRHCAASAAMLNYPCTHLDMVRPGIALYGHYPAPGMEYTCRRCGTCPPGPASATAGPPPWRGTAAWRCCRWATATAISACFPTASRWPSGGKRPRWWAGYAWT